MAPEIMGQCSPRPDEVRSIGYNCQTTRTFSSPSIGRPVCWPAAPQVPAALDDLRLSP